MAIVFLVCTCHKEAGSANAPQLYAILRAINPDVAFIEVPSETADNQIEAIMDGNLESEAVKLFQRSHQIELVPVDLATPTADFFEHHQSLHITVEAKSRKYREIADTYSARLRKHGFFYLNSEHCTKDLAGMNEEIDEYLNATKDENLREIQTAWINQNSKREAAMCRAIATYCNENIFDRAVFLVGAAHRQGIIEEASKYDIEWNFDGKGYWYPQRST